MTVGDDTLTFFYDASGNPLSLIHNGTTYYYATNLQGDVVALLNDSGTAVVTYTYDAWGKLLTTDGTMASTLGVLNPIRYRGYVYDTETGLYYLQTRYYDPEVGRFINSDILVSTGQGLLGNNMFAYCRNNPVCRKDACGTDDIRVTDNNSNDNPLDDAGTTYTPGGSSGGGDSGGGLQGNLLPVDYYYNKIAPKQSTPFSSYDNYKLNDYTGEWEHSTSYYDIAGRQACRIDWTNHGRADHGNPHIHMYNYNRRYPDGISRRID